MRTAPATPPAAPTKQHASRIASRPSGSAPTPPRLSAAAPAHGTRERLRECTIERTSSWQRISSWLIQLVRFRRHDEVVAMQALDLVRPPCDRRPTPFGQQGRVMPLFLCTLAYLLREVQR